jgi:putative phosphoribosyl transferase
MRERFEDRREAGRRLAAALRHDAGRPDVVVLGLPRGGVPVAAEVARMLGLPLDVLVVRKLGTPGQEELAMGAIASGGVRVLNPEVVGYLGLPDEVIDRAAEREGRELERRDHLYREGRPPLSLRGRTAILVDDGVATGSTMKAAVAAVRQLGAARVVVAVPVASREAEQELERLADEVVALATPEPFYAVGLWYGDFAQTSDEEVRQLLGEAHAERGAGAEGGAPTYP